MISAQDAQDRVVQMIALTERLTNLLAEEALAFEGRRLADIAASAPEMARLANMYRHESARIKADPRLINGAPQPKPHPRRVRNRVNTGSNA